MASDPEDKTARMDLPLDACGDVTDITAGTVELGTVEIPANTMKRVGPYALERQIGRGAMGTVFLAEHIRLKRKIALKVLPSEFAMTETRLKRFYREMEAVGRLDHPNIVRATDAGEVDGVHYLAMELVDGLDLAQILRRVGTLDVASACEVTRQTAVGLTHINHNSLVHRDIKPSNLILSKTGEVKILDLGIAMLLHEENQTAATATGATIGTPDYIAPEQIDGSSTVDIRADIYSLGCTFYNLLAGTPPFAGPGTTTRVAKMIAHVREKPLSLRNYRSDLPRELCAVVDRMMAKRPEDRYASPAEVAEALAPWAKTDHLSMLLDAKPDGSGVAHRVLRTRRNRFAAFDVFHRHRHIAISLGVVTSLLAVGSQIATDRAIPDGQEAGRTESLTLPVATRMPQAEADDQTLQQIARDTSYTRQQADRLEHGNRQIAQSLDKLRAAFQSAQQTGKLVEHPSSVADLYVNACMNAKIGRADEALELFEESLRLSTAFLDVHQRFQALARVHRGIDFAREFYATIPRERRDRSYEIATGWLEEDDAREQILRQLVTRQPNCAVATYELSKCLTLRNRRQPTLYGQSQERKALARFLELAIPEHKWTDCFIDQTVAAEMMSFATQRLADLATVDESALASAIELGFRPAGDRWTMEFLLKESPREIFYRLNGSESFQSTGFADQTDPSTQSKYPVTSVQLPGSVISCDIEVEYADLQGNRIGPRQFHFDANAQRLAYVKRELARRHDAWVSFRFDPIRGDVARFNYVSNYHPMIREVRYGIDQEEADTPLTLTSDGEGEGEWLVVDIPAKCRFVTVVIVFVDGTQHTARVER